MRRFIFPVVLGLVGCGILISLGLWQVRRLGEKEAFLSDITARIAGDAVPLPAPDDLAAAEADADLKARLRYQVVTVAGRTTGEEIVVLSGQPGTGAGYEIISAFLTDDGRRIMLDRGFVPEDQETTPRPPVALAGAGNLDWPSEGDSYTPAPDLGRRMWFARDVDSMAAFLKTEPVLVVARSLSGDAQGIAVQPIGTDGIPNNHLNYAITWFSLAVVWAGMTGFLLWRIRLKRM